MAALTRQDVLDIAQLARLHLEPDEVERLRGELSAILEHMEALRAVDTTGIEPMTHAVPMQLRLRADEPGEPLSVDDAVGQAPDRAGDLFQVPHILKTAAGARADRREVGAAGDRQGESASEGDGAAEG
ncbi:MAG TPA: Asp-tRNA(Asn)/Glu-tRNA(Gln) amidotransferase subunit GatC, partial [Kofleriaceae bacterium]|nr:Asp-tRNA(Asn)/Glu-tRNA(Gln) amidotransferase subunit GatC [Kofleriaceae bacterium]